MSTVHDLSLRQLQYVVAVADTLGFHRAAERCHVSQPTLSAQVQHIEDVLGVQIFERDRRRVLVTPAGEALVTRARRILLDVDDLFALATRARDPFAGTVRLGVIPTVAPYLLPEITPAITARYPALKLVYVEEKTDALVRALDDGRIDAALLALEAEIGERASATVLVDPFVLALPKGHPLAKRKRVSPADLGGQTVLLLDDGHCFRTQALAVCSQAGANETAFRATSLATLAQMVSAGAGVTLLPSLAIAVENRRGQLELRPFTSPAPHRTLALVWRQGSPLSAAFGELAEILRRAVQTERKTERKTNATPRASAAR